MTKNGRRVVEETGVVAAGPKSEAEVSVFGRDSMASPDDKTIHSAANSVLWSELEVMQSDRMHADRTAGMIAPPPRKR